MYHLKVAELFLSQAGWSYFAYTEKQIGNNLQIVIGSCFLICILNAHQLGCRQESANKLLADTRDNNIYLW